MILENLDFHSISIDMSLVILNICNLSNSVGYVEIFLKVLGIYPCLLNLDSENVNNTLLLHSLSHSLELLSIN